MEKIKGCNLKIEYDSSLNQIKANTLLNSLLYLTQALNIINEHLNEMHGTNKKFEIKINAFSKGSFLVDMDLNLINIEDSSKSESSYEANDIVYNFIGMIVLKRFLGIRKPTTIKHINSAEIIIENDRGNQSIINNNVFKLYNSNDSLHDKVTNFFKALNEDRLIESVVFKLNNIKFIGIIRNYYPDLSEEIKVEYLEDVKDLYKDAK